MKAPGHTSLRRVELDDADIGLTDATLTVTTEYTIAQGSILGDPARPHAHIKRIANGARITGPTDDQNLWPARWRSWPLQPW